MPPTIRRHPSVPGAGNLQAFGFVENIHPNGPQVYAHEQYHLQHAVPRTEYTVTLHIYGPDTDL